MYELNKSNTSKAIVGQLTSCINFPNTIRKAWDDGVRIFLCHGPRSNLSSTIEDVLENLQHVAIPLDIETKNTYEQMLFAALSLWCIGVPINWDNLNLGYDIKQQPTITVKLRLCPINSVKFTTINADFIDEHIVMNDKKKLDLSLLYTNLNQTHLNYLKNQRESLDAYHDLILTLIEEMNNK